MTASFFALAGVVLLSAAAQVTLKRAAGRLTTGQGIRALISSMTPDLYVAGILFLTAPLLYFYALTRFELGFAFLFTALTQGFVAIGGWLLLGERLRPMHLVGICLVVAGVLLWNL